MGTQCIRKKFGHCKTCEYILYFMIHAVLSVNAFCQLCFCTYFRESELDEAVERDLHPKGMTIHSLVKIKYTKNMI